MPLVIVTAAQSYALTTAAQIEAVTGIAGVSSGIILAASAMVVARTRRAWAYETVRETMPGSDSYRLLLSRRPVASITTVKEYGTTLDSGDYALEDATGGVLFRTSGWAANRGLAPGASRFPATDTGELPFEVTYPAGYWLASFTGSQGTIPSLPDAIHQAAIELSKALHLRRAEAGGAVVEEATPDYRVKRAEASDGASAVGGLSIVAEALLAPYEALC